MLIQNILPPLFCKISRLLKIYSLVFKWMPPVTVLVFLLKHFNLVIHESSNSTKIFFRLELAGYFSRNI